MIRLTAFFALFVLSACTSVAPPAPADAFMANLQRLCGKAFEGRLVTSDPADSDMASRRLVMHVRQCAADEVRIDAGNAVHAPCLRTGRFGRNLDAGADRAVAGAQIIAEPGHHQ